MPLQPELLDINVHNLNAAPCCGIQNPAHPGLASKRCWLQEHFELGLKARSLIDVDGKPCGYIEYLPGEYAWRGIDARGYMFIHCIWNPSKRNRSKGWASAMVEACVSDAKKAGMLGVAVTTRKGPWMAGSALFESNGFQLVDTAPPDYEIWVRKFKARSANPMFKKGFGIKAVRLKDELTIIHSPQCPYIAKFTAEIVQTAREEYGIAPRIIELNSYRDAQDAPTPYAVFSILSNGKVLADHQISRTRFRNIMRTMLAKAR
jgi:hypothetical protein